MPGFSDLESYNSSELEAAKLKLEALPVASRDDSLESLRGDLNLLTQTLFLMLLRIEEIEQAVRAKKV